MADSSAGDSADGRRDDQAGAQTPDRRRIIDLVRIERGEPERRNLRRGSQYRRSDDVAAPETDG